jgi:hypothetical protein
VIFYMQEGFPEEAPHVTLQSLYKRDTIKGTPRAQVFDKARAEPSFWVPLAVRLLIVIALTGMRELGLSFYSLVHSLRGRPARPTPPPL